MTKVNPRKIDGPWADGRVLDLHSTGSEFLGYDEYGHEQFDTRRTEVGELLYRLKYRSDASAVEEIGAVAEKFIRAWRVRFDVIVPAPPTRTRRVQPLHQIADELGQRFGVPVVKAVSKKAAGAAELLDDLIRSGATLSAVARALAAGGAATVFAFALTKTRRV